VRGNDVIDTGVMNQGGDSFAAIGLVSTSGVVERNYVKNSANVAVGFSNVYGGVRVLDNVIENACVRMTDCGGIYAYGQTTSTLRGQIARNSIRGERPNHDGTVTKAYVVGVYLDELSNQFDVLGNMISDVEIGIILHKAKDNNVLDNRVWLASEVGIKAQAESEAPDSVRGNVIKGNTIFLSRHFEIPADNAIPQRSNAVAQQWIHPVSTASLFSGASPNVISGNTTVLFGSPSDATWSLRSGQVQTTIGFNAWKALASDEMLRVPLDAQMAKVSGTALTKNGEMNAPDNYWKSYFYAGGSGGYASLATPTACTSSCLDFRPGKPEDYFYQPSMSNASWTASSLYYLRYTAKAGSNGGQLNAEIRKDFSPFAVSGYKENGWDLIASSKTRQEAFFRPLDASNLRLSIKGKVGANVYYDDVQLVRVNSMSLFDPMRYSAHLVNSSTAPMSFTCPTATLASCNVVDDLGKAISWPVTVAPGASKMVFAVDGNWTSLL
jgi:parallel beta-helix repeat protein